MKKMILLLLLLSFNIFATGYDAVNRWKILEDGIKTQEMMFPIKHDFVFGVKGYINTDIFTILKDAKDANTSSGATDLVKKFDKTEQMARVGLDLAIPLPSFTIKELNFHPNLRVNGTFGFLTSFENKNFSTADVLQFIPSSAQALKDVIGNCGDGWSTGLSTTHGKDVAKAVVANCTLTTTETIVFKALYGKIILPIGQDTVLNTYLNIAGTAGLFFDLDYGENFYGKLDLYGQLRRDFLSAYSVASIAAGAAAPDPTDVDNTTVDLNLNFSVGYKKDSWSVLAGVEELNLSNISKAKQGKLSYNTESLIRVHGNYLFDLGFMKVTPFAGFAKRASYSLSDGIYGGSDLRVSLLNEALMFRMRGTLDKTYITLAPMFKFWIMNIDLMVKTPMKQLVDGVKPPTILGLNLRFAI